MYCQSFNTPICSFSHHENIISLYPLLHQCSTPGVLYCNVCTLLGSVYIELLYTLSSLSGFQLYHGLSLGAVPVRNLFSSFVLCSCNILNHSSFSCSYYSSTSCNFIHSCSFSSCNFIHSCSCSSFCSCFQS